MSLISGIACIADARDRCGEGAVWHEGECAVYWTDINRFLIHRLDIVSDALREWHFGEPVVTISLTSDPGTLLVALGSRLLFWRPCTDTRFDHGFTLEGWPRVRFNDGRADPCGNFWIGSMRNNVNADGSTGTCGGTDGKLFKVSPNGDVTVWRQDIGISNTLCWSPDRKTFYFGDSLANIIYSYDFDAERGEIANERPYFAGFERGIPDGSAVDCEGFLWNCRYGGGCIVRIAPDGSIDGIIEMPTPNPTTCMFGGRDLRKLYVTSAEDLSDCSAGFGGSLFEIGTEVMGLPEKKYILR